MRDAGDARIDGGQPVAERSAHRDPERSDATRVDIGPRGKPAERRREFAQHLARQRAASPQPGLGQRALALASPPAEARQVDGERDEAGAGQDWAERSLQRRPAVEQFARADVVAVAVGMDVQDRGKRTIRFRAGEDAVDRFSRLRLESEPFRDVVATVVDLMRRQPQRVTIDFEQRSQGAEGRRISQWRISGHLRCRSCPGAISHQAENGHKQSAPEQPRDAHANQQFRRQTLGLLLLQYLPRTAPARACAWPARSEQGRRSLRWLHFSTVRTTTEERRCRQTPHLRHR